MGEVTHPPKKIEGFTHVGFNPMDSFHPRGFLGTGVGSFVGTLHGAGATSTGFRGHEPGSCDFKKWWLINKPADFWKGNHGNHENHDWFGIFDAFFLALQIISTSEITFEMCQCLVRPSSPPLRSCNLPQSKEWRVLLKQWPRPCTEMDIHISGFVIDSIYRNLPLLGETIQLDSYLFEWVANTQYLIVSYCCHSYLTHRYSSYHQYSRIVYNNYDTCSGISCCILLPISAIILMPYLKNQIASTHWYHQRKKTPHFSSFPNWPWLLKVKHLPWPWI